MLTAVGQLLFRMHYVRAGKVYLVAAFSTFLAVPAFSYFALLNLSLSFVYMSTALIHVMVLFLSYVFLHERMSSRQLASTALIVAGILVFNY